MKYYLIAGERSGDMHAGNLMRAILQNDTQAEFRYFGGEAMQAVGGTLVKHYREMAFMGVWEVLMNLRTISRLLKECRQDVEAWQPDAIILVDYSGFNLRIAQYIKDQNLPIKTIFYISPKVWAYRQKRALRIKRLIDCMLVIFPFEVDFYQKFDYKVHYVGNPLLDSVAQFTPNPSFKAENHLSNLPTIALLPGSRKQELVKILPTMLEATLLFPKDEKQQYQFVVAGVSNVDKSLYDICQKYPHVKIVWDSSYDLLQVAQGAIVTSGTATLETALFRVPQVVVYRTSWLTYEVVKRIIKVPYISLVNLIAQKEVVKELIQQDFQAQKIYEELRKVLPVVGELHYQTLAKYDELRALMGEAGASTHSAEVIKNFLA
ncbi:MAG: lipid-A-disaccharide synthase [Bacteroidetes bacterium]|nr:MAG: lipid-A-disaccharide synthase [Bacteroidota bacterium]